ncbi:hypothetical protein GTA08_BOTSDO00135 [Botryosphaeria dothidea]|uniref:DUF3533 domain-containing protein n=1 Tax=Botryosphaeria dothidea TaxID=55169 RepID=A0A8H4J8G5_9PEZI|nr:hypothetical protein GTA08_BOTSDO00135 [Botryosphaeria dothidea]
MGWMKCYPRALENRYKRHDEAVHADRHAFIRAAILNFLQLQLLFLAVFSYVFGAIWQQSGHTHNLHILYVDYDGGVVGQAVRDAYTSLHADDFPTLVERQVAEYPSSEDLQPAVCDKTSYWAALFAAPGASIRLDATLRGLINATAYNKSDVLTFIWNEAKYPTVVDSAIAGNMQKLSDAARNAYIAANGSDALQHLTCEACSSPSAVSVFAEPWVLSDVNLQKTTQGSRIIYNTLVVLLLLIQEFFYLGTINGLYAKFRIASRLHPMSIALVRLIISLAYTLVGSVATSGAIWAFRAGWNVSASQFVLTWLTLWLFAHVNFLTLDLFTVWLPASYVPMALITWAMINLSSILVPFELVPAFYHWMYALPAHEAFQVLVHVWSNGCNPQLQHALPVLFAYEVVGVGMSILGSWRRCHYAVIAEEVQEKALQRRVDERLAATRRVEELASRGEDKSLSEAGVQEEAQDVVPREEQRELRRLETVASRATTLGPSFDLAVDFVWCNPRRWTELHRRQNS